MRPTPRVVSALSPVSMTSLQGRVRQAIARDGLIPPGSRVLAAVSGGSDSVAMLLLLLDVAGECGFTVAGVAHVNHGLRGRASDQDEAFCRKLAGRLGLPFESRRRDVASLARAGRVSVEVAARQARYACLAEMAGRLGADVVATGHTRDDQAETLLLRLLRGAGASGLSGIRPRTGRAVRPLLDIRHTELRSFLDARRQRFRSDATNRDVSVPRNWVRHRLLPMLARQLDADIVNVLARSAAVLRDEDAFLDELAAEAAGRAMTVTAEGALRLDARALASMSAALARRVVRFALGRVGPGRFHGFDHVERVLTLARAPKTRDAADLPGVRVERNGPGVVLYNRGVPARRASAGVRRELPVPGRVDIPEWGCVIEARLVRRASPQLVVRKALDSGLDTAVVDAAAAGTGLAVRSRRPGDRIAPLGLRGRKKLQDVLVDRKVARGERDRVPLVVNGEDRILWVAGHVVSQDARVTDSTRSVVVLKLIRNGEEGDEA